MSSVLPLTRSNSFASFVTAIMDDLKPGIYEIQLADSLEKGNTYVDLSGQDLRTIIGARVYPYLLCDYLNAAPQASLVMVATINGYE